uniref:Acetyl-coenzyme A carboxylase carboxyl transferase subunit beta domain-containing protein n=1 Tax=Palpitomonas bilix TaxID=652834 RepID=A0A7S3GGZ4_9EUKA|mmetsp:Transcript_49140/g.126869  ORF Transcript_49140/g.126869 Transcript_49140/m.126869 type:complete len:198 (+) Transcript_49140:3-596(+)
MGKLESDLFISASKLSRKLGVPRVYVAATAGVKLGLAEEVKSKFLIKWQNDDIQHGVEYFFLKKEDAMELLSKKSIIGTWEGDTFIIDTINGIEDVGVQTLKLGAEIVVETVHSYNETVTISYVSGGCVGVGAYNIFLGHRAFIHSAHPVLLTGYAAINSVLGREMYSSNLQLGGQEVMTAYECDVYFCIIYIIQIQ